MFYQFKKNDFLVLCQQQQGGALVTVSRDGHIGQNLCFATVAPGNLYMLSNNKWTLIDVKGVVGAKRKYGDYMERASAALSVAITRLPIGNTYLKLELGEFQLIETVVYDLSTRRRISWLPPAAIYYLGNSKMVTVIAQKATQEFSMPATEEELKGWDPRTGLKPIVPTPVVPIVPPPRQTPQPPTPRLVISPAVTPTAFQSPVPDGTPRIVYPSTGPVRVKLNIVQKRPDPAKTKKKPKKDGPLVLPPITIKPDPNYDPKKVVGSEAKRRRPGFYEMVERRGRWKREHPNWREEMYPNREKEHEEYMKEDRELEEKKRSDEMRKKEQQDRRIQDVREMDLDEKKEEEVGLYTALWDADTIEDEPTFEVEDMAEPKGKEEDTAQVMEPKGKEEEDDEIQLEDVVGSFAQVGLDEMGEMDDVDEVDTLLEAILSEDTEEDSEEDTIEDPSLSVMTEFETPGETTLPVDRPVGTEIDTIPVTGEDGVETTLPMEREEDDPTQVPITFPKTVDIPEDIDFHPLDTFQPTDDMEFSL